ncbi:uncharacterized protein LOC117292780 [Asterias rubens]|uniref:uncharacterized protein LOC117292780 n=1 Tax=Asterias rubens TaxID=7604 RepID=UPI0014553DE0|nr:uncharacterized protein LOC117292780 [Asterias rubens]
MAMVYDVCIVGAGMWGSTAARYVSGHKDLTVCLVGPEEPSSQEFPTREIFGAHYDAGRIYTKFHDAGHVGRIRSVLSERAITRFPELETQSGMQFYKEVGFIQFGDCIDEFDSIPEGGVQHSASAIQQLYPYIDISADSPNGILAQTNAGYLIARDYVKAQTLVARRQGCDVITDVVNRVTNGLAGDDHVLVETEGGKKLRAKRVLLCTGAFTHFKDLLPEGCKLDAMVTTDIAVRFEIDAECAERLRDMPSVTSDFQEPSPRECYILPPIKYPDGKIYVKIGHGGYLEETLSSLDEVKRWYTEPADMEVVDKLKTIFHSIIKGVKPLSEIYYTCADLDTATHLPYCGMVSSSVGVLVGGNSYGAMMAEEMGRIGADMITGRGEWDCDVLKDDLRVRYIST